MSDIAITIAGAPISGANSAKPEPAQAVQGFLSILASMTEGQTAIVQNGVLQIAQTTNDSSGDFAGVIDEAAIQDAGLTAPIAISDKEAVDGQEVQAKAGSKETPLKPVVLVDAKPADACKADTKSVDMECAMPAPSAGMENPVQDTLASAGTSDLSQGASIIQQSAGAKEGLIKQQPATAPINNAMPLSANVEINITDIKQGEMKQQMPDALASQKIAKGAFDSSMPAGDANSNAAKDMAIGDKDAGALPNPQVVDAKPDVSISAGTQMDFIDEINEVVYKAVSKANPQSALTGERSQGISLADYKGESSADAKPAEKPITSLVNPEVKASLPMDKEVDAEAVKGQLKQVKDGAKIKYVPAQNTHIKIAVDAKSGDSKVLEDGLLSALKFMPKTSVQQDIPQASNATQQSKPSFSVQDSGNNPYNTQQQAVQASQANQDKQGDLGASVSGRLAKEAYGKTDATAEDKSIQPFKNLIKTDANPALQPGAVSKPDAAALLASNRPEAMQRTVVINEHHFVFTRKTDTSVEVTLKPEGLGRLQVEVSIEKGVLSAHINASDPQAKEIIERNLQSILNELSKDGLNVAGFSVSLKNGNGKGMSGGKQAFGQTGPSSAQFDIDPAQAGIKHDGLLSIYA